MQRLPLYRVVVFVPSAALGAVKQGILAVDALAAGDYEHGCGGRRRGSSSSARAWVRRPCRVRRAHRSGRQRAPGILPPRSAAAAAHLRTGHRAASPWQVPVVQVEEIELLLADARLL
jgi:hypothetical protein